MTDNLFGVELVKIASFCIVDAAPYTGQVECLIALDVSNLREASLVDENRLAFRHHTLTMGSAFTLKLRGQLYHLFFGTRRFIV